MRDLKMSEPKRRDYSAKELDDRPLAMIRSYAPNVLVWTGPKSETLADYIEARQRANKMETERGR